MILYFIEEWMRWFLQWSSHPTFKYIAGISDNIPLSSDQGAACYGLFLWSNFTLRRMRSPSLSGPPGPTYKAKSESPDMIASHSPLNANATSAIHELAWYRAVLEVFYPPPPLAMDTLTTACTGVCQSPLAVLAAAPSLAFVFFLTNPQFY